MNILLLFAGPNKGLAQNSASKDQEDKTRKEPGKYDLYLLSVCVTFIMKIIALSH